MDVREKSSNEKRLIDADALLNEFLKRYTERERNRNLVFAVCEIKQDFADMISDFTTVDAVEVVRCRECKYWGDEDGKLQCSDGVLFARCKIHNYLLDGRHTGWCPTENDFCSYGERKEGADNG